MRLSGKIAVVVGAGQSPGEGIGNGRATVLRFVQEGAKVLAVDRDLAARRVTRDGRPVHLGPTEFRLLHHFLQHPHRVFSREQLLDRVWGADSDIELRTVDVHIRRLRLALNSAGGADLLRTVRAFGYALGGPG